MRMTRKTKALSTLVVVSLVVTLLIFFADESKYSFDFLTRPAEWRMLAFFTVAFSIIPLAIYGFVDDRNYDTSLKWALLGFSPPLILLSWLVLA